MSEHQTPRIDGSMLQSHTNRTVRIIGRVENVSSSSDRVSFYTPSASSNNVKVTLVTSADLEEFENGIWYEIIGRVLEGQDLSVRVIDVKRFGEGINESAVAGLVKFAGRASEIFHD